MGQEYEMGKKIFVGNLSFNTTSQELESLTQEGTGAALGEDLQRAHAPEPATRHRPGEAR